MTTPPTVDPSLCGQLKRIVVARVDGLEVLWDDGCGDTSVVGVPDSPPEVQAAVREGFVEGLSRAFIHPKLDPEEGNWDRRGHLVIHSAVSAYDDDASAQAALEAVLREVGKTPYLQAVGDLSLGDGGSIFEGTLPYMSDIPRRFHAWRMGSLVLFLYADGSIEADSQRIRAIAEGMQARAAG